MITSRLLTNVKIFSEIYLSCRYSSSNKPNVIKILNSENKYMYGNLVETQKQRRKKVIIEAVENLEQENIAKSIARDEIDKKIPEKQPTKTRLKKYNANKKQSDLIEESSSPIRTTNETPTDLSSNQFIFKSAVPLSEDNYPIINSEKNDMFSQDCLVKNVYNYTFSDPAVKNFVKFPSVSKIIEDTMSEKNKQVLDRWRQNMVKEMGEEGFYKHNEAIKSRGQEFHAAVLYKVLGKELEECSEVTRNALHSLSWMLEQVSHPMAVESVIAHPQLEYKGVFDCVALFRNIPVVIDWKLSDKPKKDLKDTYDAPVQVTAYIGAINHDPNYKWGVDHGLVAVAYTNGDPCDVFLLAPKHCQIYWRHWLLRLEKFKARSHLHLNHEIDEKSLLL